MAKAFDFLVFIGRFQPLHMGHAEVIRQGLARAEKLILLVGSAWQPRSVRNPWTFDEREAMARACLDNRQKPRLLVAPLMDTPYNDDAWVRNVQSTVQGLVTAHHGTPHRTARIGLIGHSKDASSYYLRLFPQWESVSVENVAGLSATPLRDGFLGTMDGDEPSGEAWLAGTPADALPRAVKAILADFATTDEFRHIRDEHRFIAQYRSLWAGSPYPPTFVTVDAVVVQSGHILLVERKVKPGAGQWALPGGFVRQDERLLDACIRELREETRLKVPTPVVRGSLKQQRVFDDPHRSSRGRTITHAFMFDLEPSEELPRVRGSDDALKAFWLPLADLDPVRMFEDHYFIIREMVGF